MENWRVFNLGCDFATFSVSYFHAKSTFFFRVKVCTKTDGTVNIHPKSVNVEETEFHYNWLVYHLKMRTSSVCRGLYLCNLFL